MTLKEAIALVNASGTHVVVPVEPTGPHCPKCGSDNLTTYMSIRDGVEWEGCCNMCRACVSSNLTHSEGGDSNETE